MWWFLGLAHAADPSPGVFLPSAGPVEAGHGEVSLTGAHAVASLFGTTWGVGGALRGGFAPVERTWVELGVGGLGGSASSCGLFGGCTGPLGWGTGGVGGSVRYDFVEGPAFSAGAFASGGVDLETGTALFGPGLVLEGGGHRVRGDLALGLAAFYEDRDLQLVPFPIGEAGVSFLIGAERRHQLRLGVAEVLPDVSWRYEADAWFVEAGITGVPFGFGGERVEVGWRF